MFYIEQLCSLSRPLSALALRTYPDLIIGYRQSRYIVSGLVVTIYIFLYVSSMCHFVIVFLVLEKFPEDIYTSLALYSDSGLISLP